DGGEEGEKGGAVLGTGVFLEGAREGEMLDSALGREAMGVGGEKGEGMIGVAFVFSEVESDAADETPEGIFFAEVGASAAGVGGDFGSDVFVELGPPLREGVGGEVFEAL